MTEFASTKERCLAAIAQIQQRAAIIQSVIEDEDVASGALASILEDPANSLRDIIEAWEDGNEDFFA